MRGHRTFRALLPLVALAASACQQGPRTGLDFPEEFPERLSTWRLLEQRDGKLEPNAGVTPYDLTSPLFSDYAHKLRTVVLAARHEHPLWRRCVRVPGRRGDHEDVLLSARRGRDEGSHRGPQGSRTSSRRIARSRPGAPARDAPVDQHVLRLGRAAVRVERRADRSDARASRRHLVAGAGQRSRSSAVRVSRPGHESMRGLSCARASLAEDRADRHSRAPLEQDFQLRRAAARISWLIGRRRDC